jgi:hypothetical protein
VRVSLPLAIVLATGATAVPAGVANAASGSIVFRCGPNLCRVAPDGSARKKLTRSGRKGGPAYGWLSANRSGSRLGVSFGNKAYVLDGSGRLLSGPFRRNGAVLVTQISPTGRKVATIELVPEVVSPVSTLSPYLYLATATGKGRDTVSTVGRGRRRPRPVGAGRLARRPPHRGYARAREEGDRRNRPLRREDGRPRADAHAGQSRLSAVVGSQRQAHRLHARALTVRRARPGRQGPQDRRGRSASLGQAPRGRALTALSSPDTPS